MLSVTALNLEGNNVQVHVQVTPLAQPQQQQQDTPVAILALIDTSGSMNAIGQQNLETEKLSSLDLVKHCLRTTVNVLREQDYLALVTFNHQAETKLIFTQMNALGKEQAHRVINQLDADGQTNLWEGMKRALELWHSFSPNVEGAAERPHQSLLMLTDGQSNVNPEQGLVESVKKYVKEQDFNGVIHALGFGYEIDSQAIFEIAESTQGSYSFISDNSMLGNVMISFLVNMFHTVHDQCDLLIQYHPLLNLPEQQLVRLGSVHVCQTRDYSFMITLPNHQQEQEPVEWVSVSALGQTVSLPSSNYPKTSMELARLEFIRKKFIHMLKEIISIRSDFRLINAAKELRINELFSSFTGLADLPMFTRELDQMLTDEGQVAKAALRADWFLKWGRHHLLALMRAHELQIRHNIKDPSVQQYSGVLPPDDRVEKRCRQAFLSVPLPSYAVKSNVQYLAGEGCIDGNCLVEMANKEMVQVSELKAGDVTASGAKVRFILINVSMTNNYPFELVKIGNLAITPWHPIQLNQTEKWVFPNDVDELKSECIVYNIVLDRDHFVMIDGIKVITLGHGIINDAVASHEYFGTNKIIDDIMKLNPDQFGRVVCYRTSWTRDSSNQRVNGMIF